MTDSNVNAVSYLLNIVKYANKTFFNMFSHMPYLFANMGYVLTISKKIRELFLSSNGAFLCIFNKRENEKKVADNFLLFNKL